jgi:hypothetical protein
MAVSLPEGEITEATTSGDTTWESNAITANVPLTSIYEECLARRPLGFRA